MQISLERIEGKAKCYRQIARWEEIPKKLIEWVPKKGWKRNKFEHIKNWEKVRTSYQAEKTVKRIIAAMKDEPGIKEEENGVEEEKKWEEKEEKEGTS